MQLDTLASTIIHGHMNWPSASTLIVLMVLVAWVVVTFIKRVF